VAPVTGVPRHAAKNPELRSALLTQLQRLGPSFYRKKSTGDIMSRSTNDLGQVRLLFGFGALNSMNTVFALYAEDAQKFWDDRIVVRGGVRQTYGTTGS